MITISRTLLRLALPAIGATVALTPVQAQSPANIATVLNETYTKFKNLQEGKNADYIPALAKVDPKVFGIALVTTDGKVYTAGDIKTEVSIQSISKVFTLVMALQLESRMADPAFDILPPPREEIVDADDIVAASHQAVAQMRAEKAGSSGDEDCFSIRHIFQAGC